ncbi:endonuclease/exonuclease/phosphatase family protein [Streptomyces sp. YIM 98790]|uniref:endonuclease/exonuclease/phosphatase family protein n=1 Tax=Streptomyces sp. YIM 98790 TaxID=2689077 RepID=UPI00140B0876|nr:endonuclease/exonuclease/phosphatase family protein [Streptomyces sp. YIM 98790]
MLPWHPKEKQTVPHKTPPSPRSSGRPRQSRRLRLGLVTSGVAASLVLTPLPLALAAPSADVMLGEVYGGGGNSGATLTRDFIELANAGGSAVPLDGWSVQYLPGSPSSASRWQVTALDGSIAPGGRYLVSENAGSGGTVELPAPDAAGSISMSATSGTVALVSSTEALTCRTAADCAADDRIVDLVGYGSAVVREGGGPAAGAGNTSSVARPGTPPADTDDNAADFTSGTPTPVNSAGQTPGDGGGEEPPTEPGDTRIRDIQGATRISPLSGGTVTAVPGVVTAVSAAGSRGFWMQDPEPDADPATSEGVFVYTGSEAPAVSAGDGVLVSGRVTEYFPASGTQSLTEITRPEVTVVSSGNALPEPVTLDAATVPGLYAPDAAGGPTDDLKLEPGSYALDLYESLEGMLVSFSDVRTVSRTTDYDELWITVKPEENPSARGGTRYGSYDSPNTGRLKVMSLAGELPTVDVGDTLAGTTTGAMDYSRYGGYTVQATALGERTPGGLAKETTRAQTKKELAVATYNVENLSAADSDEKFAELAAGIVQHLASPDIVALEEIQDNTGPAGDGTVAADQTMARFTAAIEAAGGPSYEWRSIDPVDGADGGQPGGNIRLVFLFNPERVSFTDRPGGDATTAVEAVQTEDGARLSVSPGRISPESTAWENSRKPLAGEFVFRGKTYFVIANHFASKGGDQPLHGRNQPPARTSETQRHQQAAEVNAFVKDLLAADPKARVIALGDFNDFEFSATMDLLTDGGVLENLLFTLPAEERYTYVFDGNSQTLDHILVSPAIGGTDYDVVHINAEFADQASDHDPQVVRIDTKGHGKGHGKGDGGPDRPRHPLHALAAWLHHLLTLLRR